MTCIRTFSTFSTFGIALALALTAACGKPADPTDDPSDTRGDPDAEPDDWSALVDVVPGSRLRPVVRVADDGTRTHVGWHDTLLDTDCEFRSVAGVLRCVPEDVESEPWLYADPQCSQPVIQDIHIEEGQQVFRVHGNGCFDSTFYEIGEPVSQIYYAANGPCEVFSEDPSHRVYAFAAEEFVAAKVTPQEGSSEIVPMLLEADDGARAIVGAWDKVNQEEVTPDLDASGELRWFGRYSPRVSTYYYADSACTERVAIAECVPPGEHPGTAIDIEPGACVVVLGRHSLLEEVSSVYAGGSDGGCAGASLSGSARAWRVGEPLGDDAFAPTPTIDDGGTRLRHDVYASPEGEPFLSSPRVFDSQLNGVECRWWAQPYGSKDYACVPKDAAIMSNVYADAACTQRTASRFVDAEFDCPGPAVYAYSSADGVVVPILEPRADVDRHVLDAEEGCVPFEPDPEWDDFSESEHFLVDESAAVAVAKASDVVE